MIRKILNTADLEEQVIAIIRNPKKVPGFLLVMDVTSEDKDKSFRDSLKLVVKAHDIQATKEKDTSLYHTHLLSELKDRKFALEYLQAAVEENFPELFKLAVRNIAEAHGVF